MKIEHKGNTVTGTPEEIKRFIDLLEKKSEYDVDALKTYYDSGDYINMKVAEGSKISIYQSNRQWYKADKVYSVFIDYEDYVITDDDGDNFRLGTVDGLFTYTIL